MANAVLAFPNYVDVTFYDVIICGGSWQTALPLSNLKDRLLSKVARSSDDALASTLFHIDLGAPRQITNISIPKSNLDRSALYQIKGTNTPAWTGVTVNGAHLAADDTLAVSASVAATISANDYLTLPGDSQVYKVTVGATLAAGGSGTITISPALTMNHSNAEVVTCRVGDYSSPVKSITWKDVWPVVYDMDDLLFESSSGWTGKIAEEDAQNYTMPIVETFTGVVCRYWKFEFDNTTNDDGYIDLSRLFMSSGWQPSLNMDFGFSLGYETDTQVDTALGGARWYDIREGRRVARFTISLLPVNEALVNPLEMQRSLGKHKQIMFIFDPDDTVHMHRRAFLATIRQLSPLEYPVFDRNSVAYEIEEVIQ